MCVQHVTAERLLDNDCLLMQCLGISKALITIIGVLWFLQTP